MTALPRLHPDIPIALQDAIGVAAKAKLADLLIRADVAAADDVGRGPVTDWGAVCVRLLADDLNARLGSLAFGEGLTLECIVSHAGSPLGPAVQLLGYGGDVFGSLQDRVARLQAAVPGLGESVLHLIDVIGQCVLPTLSPSVLLEQYRHIVWMGGEDESDWLAMVSDEDPERLEEMREAVMSLEAFREAWPRWVIEPGRPPLDRVLLHAACQDDPWVAQVWRYVEPLLAMNVPELAALGRHNDENAIFNGWVGELRWAAGEPAYDRVLDDLRHHSEGMDWDEFSLNLQFAFDDGAQASDMLAQLRLWCAAVRLLDGLLAAVVTRD